MPNFDESFEDEHEASASEAEGGEAEPEAEVPEGDDSNEADEGPPTKKRKTNGNATSKYEGPA